MTASVRSRRNSLLVGASLATLAFAGAAQAQNLGAGRTASPAVAAAQATQGAAARNAAAQAAAARTRASFDQASRVRQQMDAAQAAARAAALAAQSNVPNGLGSGGLQVADGVGIDPRLWLGANGPTQTQGADGRTDVTVEQTQEKAILTWDSFNVGRETDLTFDQQGNNNWVALNRVTDASLDPSQILGSIKADGSVYIINPNGVIFGGASQVNVRNLVASTLEIHGGNLESFRPDENELPVSDERWEELKKQARDQRFMDGLFGANTQDGFGTYRGSLTFWDGVTGGLAQQDLIPEVANAAGSTAPGVSVAAGARIATVNSGMVMLVGRNVDNSGTISAPSGQVLLAAGRGVTMIDGTSRTFGTDMKWPGDSREELFKVPGYIAVVQQGGRTSNDGLLQSTRGNISLVGAAVQQNGLISATTGVDKAGSIILDASTKIGLSGFTPNILGDVVGNGDWRGAVTIGDLSHMSVLPDRNGQTAPGSVFTPSNVEIVGNQIVFAQGSVLWAPGGNLHVFADGLGGTNPTAGRIYVEQGALLDVSGLNGVTIDMEQNSVKAELRANELADNPVVRDGGLRGETVYFDGRLGGELTADGDGVADLSGWYDLIQRDVEQFMTVGGSVILRGAEIITREGSTIDISGGSVVYNDGYVRRTTLIDAYGRLVPIEEAIAGVRYVGVEGDAVINHARWGVTERFENPFARVSQGTWQKGYVEGRSAGSLTINASRNGTTTSVGGFGFTGDLARIFDGEVAAGVIIGDHQRGAPTGAGVTDLAQIWRERPSLGRLVIGETYQLGNGIRLNGGDIVIGARETVLGSDFGSDSALFDAGAAYASLVDGVTTGKHVLSSEWFDGETFGDVTIHSGDSVDNLYTRTATGWALKDNAPTASSGGVLTIGEDVTLDLGDYGSFSFIGRQALVDGTILAAGGKVSLEGTWPGKLEGSTSEFNAIPDAFRPGVTLGATGVIDVAGRWTNNYLESLNGLSVTNAVVDGGDVYLQGYRITLAKGSQIDVSGGAQLATNGETLTLGDGGAVTLDFDTTESTGLQLGGGLINEGRLSGYGPGKGGALNIYASDQVVIGDSLGDLEVIRDGVLEAGTPAPQDVALADPLVIPSGEPMPIDVTYSSTLLPPGVAVADQTRVEFNNYANPIVLGADWTVPEGYSGEIYDVNNGFWYQGLTIPAGTALFYFSGSLQAGSSLPADAFPTGIQLSSAVILSVPKGTVLDADFTIPAGALLARGSRLTRNVSVPAPRNIKAAHFNQGGFADFAVTGAGGLIIGSGTVVAPTYDALQIGGDARTIATSEGLFDLASVEGSGVTLVQSSDLPEWQRQGTDLILGSQPASLPGSGGIQRGSGWAGYREPEARDVKVTMEAGAEIRLAPESRVLLNGTNTLFVDGLIEARGGEIILQETQHRDGLVVRVGDNARLLVGGYQSVVGNIDGQDVRAVAAGGSIRIASVTSSQQTAQVLVGQGAVLDASGVAGIADLPGPSADGDFSRAISTLVPVSTHGAGGEIIINATHGLIAGDMRLAPGGETGLGGRLIFNAGGDATYVIQDAVEGVGPVVQDTPIGTDTLVLSAERISAAGADDLTIGLVMPNQYEPSTVLFDGAVRLAARRSVVIEANRLSVMPSDLADGPETNVEIEAAYVRVNAGGSDFVPPVGVAERNSLTVRAGLIDLMGGLALMAGDGTGGFAQANFIASGDIRLLGSRGFGSGGLSSAGAIAFTSAQVYVAPTSGSIDNEQNEQFDPPEASDGYLVNSPVSVTVQGNGNATLVPLAWGGKLTLRAPEILQAGTLRAPLGSIVLDAIDSADAEGNLIAGRLTLAAGSLTSVSLEGTVSFAGLTNSQQKFFGYLRDDWAPSKAVVLSGGAVDLREGAVVDISGGGDLIGYSFATGAGGRTNVLNENSLDAAFAIIPGYDGPTPTPVGAMPLGGEAGWLSSNPGNNVIGYRSGTSDERLRVGDQVYLTGLPGLADGYYTLMPASFALLEGGMLVKPTDGPLSAGPQSSQGRDDGSVLASGFRAVAGTSIRPDQGWSSFQVMNGKTWRQYSAITTQSFNQQRAATNAETGQMVRTPQDAGRLVIEAADSLKLLGGARVTGGAGDKAGLAGDIDISNPGGAVALVRSGQAGPDGWLAVDAGAVQAFAGGGSLLLGGRRPITTRVNGGGSSEPDPALGGTTVTTTATDVLIGEGVAFNGLEIILAATDTIIVGDNARLSATGGGTTNTADLLMSGDGALLRLSSGGRVGLVRTDDSGATGSLSLGSGSELNTKGSLSLDASAGFDLPADALLNVGQLDLASNTINIGDTPADATGTVLSLETLERLAGASNLLLRANQALVLWGDFDLGARNASGVATLGSVTLDTPLLQGRAANGQGMTLTAGELVLRNSGGEGVATADAGTLTLDVDRLILGQGDIAIGGYADVRGSIGEIRMTDVGQLAVAGSADLTVGRVTTDDAADHGIKAAGALSLRQGAVAGVAAPSGIGGRISLAGASLVFDTTMVTPGGLVTLEATDGDLQLGSKARIETVGLARDFVDVVRYAPGGVVRLIASGDVKSDAGSVIDVSADKRGGNAGAIDVSAGGTVALAGRLLATAAQGYRGGEFALDAATTDFAALNGVLNAGRFDARRVFDLQSDIVLAAGDTIRAHEVTLRSQGDVRIAGTIAANGDAANANGGRVTLSGGNVFLDGGGRIEAAAATVAAKDYQPSSGTVVLAADEGRVTLASGSIIDLSGGREVGGRITVRAQRTAMGADAQLSGSVTGARERLLVGSAVYAADTLTSDIVAPILDAANAWLVGADAPAGWNIGAGIILRGDGDMAIVDDIDLSGIAGSGYLGIEAGGDLDIQASISDGFDSAALDATQETGSSFSFGISAEGDMILGLREKLPQIEVTPYIPAGQALGRQVNLRDAVSFPFTPSADWVLPPGIAVLDEAGNYYANNDFGAPGVVPAGTVLVEDAGFGGSMFQATYVVQAEVFPDGIYLAPELQPAPYDRRVIRTGTGDIGVRTGGDLFVGLEAAIYTAGRATPTAPGYDTSIFVAEKVANTDRILGGFPDQGGDIDISTGGDLQVYAVEQSTSAWLFRYGASNWLGNPDAASIAEQTSWSIVFKNFRSGFGALGGGDISARADGDIIDLAAALPTTGHLTTPVGQVARADDLIVRGGGDLYVRALGDIGGGNYALGRGVATLVAGGGVTGGATRKVLNGPATYPSNFWEFTDRGLGSLFGLMDAQVFITAGRGVEIEGAYDLALMPQICENVSGACTGVQGDGSAWMSLSHRSRLDAVAAGGDVLLRANGMAAATTTYLNDNAGFRIQLQNTQINNEEGTGFNFLLGRMPATVSLAAVQGDVVIEPAPVATSGPETSPILQASPTGTLELLAGGSVSLRSIPDAGAGVWRVEVEDIGVGYIRDALTPGRTKAQYSASLYTSNGTPEFFDIANNFYRSYDLLHVDDKEPVRIYALTGDFGLVDSGFYNSWKLVSPKAVRIDVGGDIGHGSFSVTHNDPTDVTSLVAGGDITTYGNSNSYTVYGPGLLWVEAGDDLLSDIGPSNFLSRGNGSAGEGLDNLQDFRRRVNYALADVGADIALIAGTSQGSDYKAFTDLYLDPANLADPAFGLSHPTNQGKVVKTYEKELDALLAKHGFTAPTADNRRELFDSLPQQTREGFLQKVLAEELRLTGIDYNDFDGPRFQQYNRGYAALHLLYPGTKDLGRDNPLGGDVLLANSRVESASGGAINIIAPYGRVQVGDPSASVINPNAGVVTRRGGDLTVLANGTISLDQSRTFTLQGGDLTMWTSKGDITAGTGAKTNVTSVPLSYRLDKNGLLSINVFGLQTGAGIGVLDAFEGRDPDRRPSRLDLLAFFGEVNAGDAGIRVVGDLNIAALRVVNAANIEVSGEAVGIPQIPAVNVGALNAASAATSSVINEAAQLAERSRPRVRTDMPTILNVRFLGFGE